MERVNIPDHRSLVKAIKREILKEDPHRGTRKKERRKIT